MYIYCIVIIVLKRIDIKVYFTQNINILTFSSLVQVKHNLKLETSLNGENDKILENHVLPTKLTLDSMILKDLT